MKIIASATALTSVAGCRAKALLVPGCTAAQLLHERGATSVLRGSYRPARQSQQETGDAPRKPQAAESCTLRSPRCPATRKRNPFLRARPAVWRLSSKDLETRDCLRPLKSRRW